MLGLLRALPEGLTWICLAVVVTFGNDTGAYFAGRFLGKHKLYPAVSPNKTWEGFFGGFVLSAIKRDRGVKDWGSMIEGHGGMLDRVDSISFSAPIFFHIVRYWWT